MDALGSSLWRSTTSRLGFGPEKVSEKPNNAAAEILDVSIFGRRSSGDMRGLFDAFLRFHIRSEQIYLVRRAEFESEGHVIDVITESYLRKSYAAYICLPARCVYTSNIEQPARQPQLCFTHSSALVPFHQPASWFPVSSAQFMVGVCYAKQMLGHEPVRSGDTLFSLLDSDAIFHSEFDPCDVVSSRPGNCSKRPSYCIRQ